MRRDGEQDRTCASVVVGGERRLDSADVTRVLAEMEGWERAAVGDNNTL
jgi:hypothetical protein